MDFSITVRPGYMLTKKQADAKAMEAQAAYLPELSLTGSLDDKT